MESGMITATNKQLMQRIFSELSKGDSGALIESMADDFVWTVTGSTKWSGAYNGKQTVLTELFAALRAKLDGQYTNTAHRFIAEGDFVVVEARGSSRTKSGLPYDNHYCFVCRIKGGRLREIVEYGDTQLVAEVLGERETGSVN
jgi:ketosteroid isomerase-like protein